MARSSTVKFIAVDRFAKWIIGDLSEARRSNAIDADARLVIYKEAGKRTGEAYQY